MAKIDLESLSDADLELIANGNGGAADALDAMSDEELEKIVAGTAAPARISGLESTLAGAAQGLGSNFLDELYGARKGVQDAITSDEFTLADVPERYKVHRDEARALYGAAEEQNPKRYATGNIGGGVAQALIPGAALAKMGPVGAAATTSGLAGLGASTADTVLGDVVNTGQAAAGGAVLGAAGKYLLPTAKGLRSMGREKAVKASGAMTKEMRALEEKGLLQAQGEFLLKHKIVTPLASLEDVAERSNAIREKAGETIGGIIDGVDDLRVKAVGRVGEMLKSKPGHAKILEKQINDEFGYNFNNVANRIDEIIARDGDVAASKFHRNKLDQIAKEFRRIGKGGSGTLRTGLRNKTEHRRLLKDVDNLGEDYKQEVYDVISDELNRAVGNFERLEDGVAKLYGSPIKGMLGDGAPELADVQAGATTALDEFGQANRDYAASAVAQSTAEKRLGQVRSNRDYGLSTGMATMAGLVDGGVVTGAAYGSFNNFLRKYGSSLQATGYTNLAGALETQPQAFGQYAAPLQEAIRRGPRQFAVSTYLIGKGDPQFAVFLENFISDGTKVSDPVQLNMERERIKNDSSLSSVEKAKRLTQINRDGFITVEPPPPAPPPPAPAPVPQEGMLDALLQSLTGAR